MQRVVRQTGMNVPVKHIVKIQRMEEIVLLLLVSELLQLVPVHQNKRLAPARQITNVQRTIALIKTEEENALTAEAP